MQLFAVQPLLVYQLRHQYFRCGVSYWVRLGLTEVNIHSDLLSQISDKDKAQSLFNPNCCNCANVSQYKFETRQRQTVQNSDLKVKSLKIWTAPKIWEKEFIFIEYPDNGLKSANRLQLYHWLVFFLDALASLDFKLSVSKSDLQIII